MNRTRNLLPTDAQLAELRQLRGLAPALPAHAPLTVRLTIAAVILVFAAALAIRALDAPLTGGQIEIVTAGAFLGGYAVFGWRLDLWIRRRAARRRAVAILERRAAKVQPAGNLAGLN